MLWRDSWIEMRQSITKKTINVRTLIFTLMLSLALCGFNSTYAQRYKTVSRQTTDTVLLSQRRDGNYTVRKYLIKNDRDCNSDFAVRYRINLSTLLPSADGNGKELAALSSFMDSLARDSTMHVHSITITGYASPDGVEASNKKLARARAVDFKNYLDQRYALSEICNCNINIEAVVDDWDACVNGLRNSNVIDRDRAVSVIRSNSTRVEKERSLKAMPAVWNYLSANVLPALRQADIEFDYSQDNITETRTWIEQPKPTPAPSKPKPQANRCCCCGEIITDRMAIIEDLSNGLIVEMGAVDIDW